MIATMVKDRGTKRNIYRCAVGKHLGRRVELVDEYVTDVLLARFTGPDAPALLHRKGSVDADGLRDRVAGLRAKLDEYAKLWAEDVMTPAQFREATIITKGDLEAAEQELYHPGVSPTLQRLVGSPDPRREWDGLEWAQKRLIRAFMTITILPVPKGAPPGLTPHSLT